MVTSPKLPRFSLRGVLHAIAISGHQMNCFMYYSHDPTSQTGSSGKRSVMDKRIARWIFTPHTGLSCAIYVRPVACLPACLFFPTDPPTFHRVKGLWTDRPVGLVVKASASIAADPGFKSRLRRDYSESSYASDFKNWHSSGCPARRLAL